MEREFLAAPTRRGGAAGGAASPQGWPPPRHGAAARRRRAAALQKKLFAWYKGSVFTLLGRCGRLSGGYRVSAGVLTV
jgi:hypothetical protein